MAPKGHDQGKTKSVFAFSARIDFCLPDGTEMGESNHPIKPVNQALMTDTEEMLSRFGDKMAPTYKKGQSGNPAGRPNAGAKITDWFNIMADWSARDLDAVMNDVNAPSSKAAAARCWIDARTGERTKVGTPIAGPELDRILDRTVGKPTQAIDVTSNGDSVKGIVGIDPDKV